MKGFLSEDRPIRTLREITTRLQEAYCNTVGYEVSLQLPHLRPSASLVLNFGGAWGELAVVNPLTSLLL